MSKITIFLCAVLFAAAADATFLASRLAVHQERLEEFVASKFEEVDRIYEGAKKRGEELVEHLFTLADTFRDKLAADMEKVHGSIGKDIELLGNGTTGIDVTECIKSDKSQERIINTVNSSIAECIVEKKEAGRAYIDDIKLAVAAIRENLSAIREESLHCADTVHGIVSSIDAIACIKMAKLDGALALSKSIPALVRNIGGMIYSLSTLKASLAFCATNHKLNALYVEYRSIVKDKKACIKNKVEAFKPAPLK